MLKPAMHQSAVFIIINKAVIGKVTIFKIIIVMTEVTISNEQTKT